MADKINAITQMMSVIKEVNKLKPGCHPLLGNGSINVGVISGGLRSSVVPDSWTLKIGKFVIKGETGPAFLKDIEKILEKLRKEDKTFLEALQVK